MEVRFSCGEDMISEFVNNGWFIFEEFSEEKIFRWKSTAANQVYDIEKDKRCKITIQDKIGKENFYLLEK